MGRFTRQRPMGFPSLSTGVFPGGQIGADAPGNALRTSDGGEAAALEGRIEGTQRLFLAGDNDLGLLFFTFALLV